ncbi:MAG: helix-turn-helix transcriptional regulator [Cytophagales bacterium]|nr:helix-turn-helix transcriptional regulator [Cytophagales bacterium]
MAEIPVYTIETLRSANTGSADFDFFRFEYFAKDIEHLRASHRHHFYTFILVTGGGGSHAIDFQKHDLVPGRLFLIGPGQVHAWIEFRKVKGFVVLFTDTYMALSKGRKMMSAWPLFRPNQESYYDLSAKELTRWTEEFLYIEEEVSRADEFTRDATFYSLSSLLVRATRLSLGKLGKRQPAGHDFLFAFQELIEENYLKWKTPRKYAEKMNMTANYLNTLCKKKSGKSAGELIRQRILLEAKRLLAHTSLSVAEIAFQMDFQDNSYFGRFFKKYVGMTPEKFRTSQIQ